VRFKIDKLTPGVNVENLEEELKEEFKPILLSRQCVDPDEFDDMFLC
jgi:hypothetical protein